MPTISPRISLILILLVSHCILKYHSFNKSYYAYYLSFLCPYLFSFLISPSHCLSPLSLSLYLCHYPPSLPLSLSLSLSHSPSPISLPSLSPPLPPTLPLYLFSCSRDEYKQLEPQATECLLYGVIPATGQGYYIITTITSSLRLHHRYDYIITTITSSLLLHHYSLH